MHHLLSDTNNTQVDYKKYLDIVMQMHNTIITIQKYQKVYGNLLKMKQIIP